MSAGAPSPDSRQAWSPSASDLLAADRGWVRNLWEALRPHAKLPGMDLTLDGTATRVTEPATLERVASIYRAIGWPAEVTGDGFTAPYSAPSAGPAPWHLYRFTFRTIVGLSTEAPYGATRWRFDQ
jgi:hypothetical protein